MNKRRIDINNRVILVTGAAGFIGANLVIKILSDFTEVTVIGFDSMTDYTSVELKEWRLKQIKKTVEKTVNKWIFFRKDLADRKAVFEVFENFRPSVVVNLAAQAGVRYSIDNPDEYFSSNIIGFYNIIEACKHMSSSVNTEVEHLIFASSASVYGGNEKVPFCIDDRVDTPVSFYAATKKSNELFAYSYSKIFNIPATGLRFFTVYGPAGREDMFYFKATKCFQNKKAIQLYNYGNCKRDFTYIDDIVDGIIKVMQGAPIREVGDDKLPIAPFSVYNIGCGCPVSLIDFVSKLYGCLVKYKVISDEVGLDKYIEYLPMQPGDMCATWADCSDLLGDYGVRPKIGIDDGIEKFVQWYRDYYI